MTASFEVLLDYYRRELEYLRQEGVRFARRYPKVAGRLELEADGSPDPHIERMLESFAFLSGRIQYNLESEFPRISTALLGNVYPQFTAPTPSMAIAHFAADPDQGGLTTGFPIPRETPLFAQSDAGELCHWRTCYPVTLWPLVVAEAALEPPDRYGFLDSRPQVARVLRIRLEARNAALNELPLQRLRFHIAGDRTQATTFYEMLFAGTDRPAVQCGGRTRLLPPDSLTPVGFGPEEAVLPYPNTAHPGYRLLHEYFTFPRKFLFFDVDLSGVDLSGEWFDLLILLERSPTGRLTVDVDTFRLGCTPVINLFPRITDPVRITETRTEYPLIPDSRRPRITEIHSLRRVTASADPADNQGEVAPYFAFTHRMAMEDQRLFWYAMREGTGRTDMPGTRMKIAFVDLDFNPRRPPTRTLFAHTMCTNRSLAEELPAGGLLQIEQAVPVIHIALLDKPTSQIDPPLEGATLWRLISHLSLNYLSLSGGSQSLDALREILRLYSFHDLTDAFRRSDIHQQIAGLREMESRQVVRRVGEEAWRGFCRGMEIDLTVDESLYVGGGAFLLASVLNRFFPLYASINTFTQLVLRSRQREGVWKRWPPAVGERIVL
ncbi:MAG: type VI secretion system baseplate subunit TssF [Desulfococcaceae bacterium]